jgi:protein CpxP
MSKNKIYSVLIIVLLLTNTILVGFMVLNPKRQMRKENQNPKEVISNRLQFNEAQSAQYSSLVILHRTAVRAKDAQIHASKKSLYSLLTSDDLIKKQEDSIINRLGNLQRDIEILHFKHFQDIKKICGPAQEDAFNKLAKTLTTLFKPQDRKPKK